MINAFINMILWSETSIKYIIENHDLENTESHWIKYKTQWLNLLSDWLNKSTQQAVDSISKCVEFFLYSKNCFSYKNNYVQLKLSLTI